MEPVIEESRAANAVHQNRRFPVTRDDFSCKLSSFHALYNIPCDVSSKQFYSAKDFESYTMLQFVDFSRTLAAEAAKEYINLIDAHVLD